MPSRRDGTPKRKPRDRQPDALGEYRRRRSFSRTPEPDGGLSLPGGKRPRFVVQRHAASHLHYDFRLEMDDVLKSWAVPKGLPETSGVRRLALQVEDHPLDYVNFQGKIPEGEYGAGTVEIWDQGDYELLERSQDELRVRLAGKRFQGEYVLIHTRENQWILLKRKQEGRPA